MSIREKEITEKTEKKGFDWLKFGKILLFPHKFIIFLLVNLTIAGLIYIFINQLQENLLAILFYVVAFYTLVVVCARIPELVKSAKTGVYANKHANKYLSDKDLRLRLSMYRGLLVNFCFATFKIVLGFVYNSSWLFAMAGYNVVLSLMRFLVIIRSQKKARDEDEKQLIGLHSYEICGWLMMILNIAVSVIIFMVIVQKQTIQYHAIVTIGLAAFTFYSFTMAIINFIKFRDRKNPVYAAVKSIDLVKAIVSIFTLQVAMLTSFGNEANSEFATSTMTEAEVGMFNTLTGVAIVIAINTIAALMIANVKKDYKKLEINEE